MAPSACGEIDNQCGGDAGVGDDCVAEAGPGKCVAARVCILDGGGTSYDGVFSCYLPTPITDDAGGWVVDDAGRARTDSGDGPSVGDASDRGTDVQKADQDGGGCSVSAAGHTDPYGPALGFLGAALAFVRRRRR